MECVKAGVREERTCQTCKVASKQRTEYGRRQPIACSNMASEVGFAVSPLTMLKTHFRQQYSKPVELTWKTKITYGLFAWPTGKWEGLSS